MRVAIIGSSGSGKSTLAYRIGARTGAPVVELDAMNWQAGWRDLATHDPALFRARIEAAVSGERWVTDGNYTRFAQEPVLARATDLVWLDYPRALIMRRVITRSFVRAVTGKELWPGTGNREQFSRWLDKEHPIRWSWDTYGPGVAARGALYERLAGGPIRLHRLRRPRDADALVERLVSEE
jgi:adenylate kinase family enzyme